MLQLWFFANTVLWPFRAMVGGDGGIRLGLNVVLLLLVGAVLLCARWKVGLGSAKVLLAFLVYAVVSPTLGFVGPCNDHIVKSVITMPILMFLILIGLEVGRRASSSDWLKLQAVAKWAMLGAFVGFGVEMFKPGWFPLQVNYRAEGKWSGFLEEPSHVAFALFPCIVLMFVSEEKKTRRQGMLALVGLLVLSRSSTLLALIVVWAMYRMLIQRKLRQTVLLTLGVGVLIVSATVVNYERFVMPIIERVAGVTAPSETENLSSLVYIQGWQDAWFNLQRTHGLGLGFNMMGCGVLPDVSARSAVLLVSGLELNSEDGSFLFSKVVSETGIIGIGFYVVAIWWWVRLEKKLRHMHKDVIGYPVLAQAALIFCFLISSFIRGSGYFDGGILLWAVAVGGVIKWSHNLSIQPNQVHPLSFGTDQVVVPLE